MMLLNTSLLRERFTIIDRSRNTPPIEAMGNRILLPLSRHGGQVKEHLIVRAHSMHIATRMASALTRIFFQNGSVLHMVSSAAYNDIWTDIVDPFEKQYNPDVWCCIYHNGRPIFQKGAYHAFLDVIEQCNIKNRSEYDRAVLLAEDIFKQAGKDASIKHDATIGVVVGATDRQIRCGLIMRTPMRTSTFNFLIEPTAAAKPMPIHPYDGLELSSYFLEGIQLAVTSGVTKHLLTFNKLKPESPRAKAAQSAYNRIGKLTHAIRTYEQTHSVRYRPEKPNFMDIMNETAQSGFMLQNDQAEGPL